MTLRQDHFCPGAKEIKQFLYHGKTEDPVQRPGVGFQLGPVVLGSFADFLDGFIKRWGDKTEVVAIAAAKKARMPIKAHRDGAPPCEMPRPRRWSF